MANQTQTTETAGLDTRIEWGAKKEVRDRWARVMTELGIPHQKSEPTTAHSFAAARRRSDRLGDDMASEFISYDTYGLWVSRPIWDAWIAAQEACHVLPAAERPAFRRAALAHAWLREAEVSA